MASAFSHVAAALAIGACFYRPGTAKRVWVAGALCAVIPDVDFVGFRLGIQYGDLLGHRGLTHSLAFAAFLGGLTTLLLNRAGRTGLPSRSLFLYLFLATASHGVLDAFTNGGLGIAFFSPFSNTRYFFPWTPIEVSPIGISRFFTRDAFRVLASELVWIWLPAGILAMLALRVRRDASIRA